jgi:hypothetical protein
MTIHFNIINGSLKSGKLAGLGEMYSADADGNGVIYKGNFVKGKLTDFNGVLITYTNSEVTKYVGTFVDHKMDGQIEVTTYIDNTPDPGPGPDPEIEGNCPCGTMGRKFLKASNDASIFSGRKKIVLFSNGIEGSVISDIATDISISVSQKIFNNRRIFNDFDMY